MEKMKYNKAFSYQMIGSTSALEGFVKGLGKEEAIALDLEADSMYHFQEKVCLIQMATTRETLLIDPLQIEDLSPLKPVFLNRDIKKVLHGADYDVRSLYRDFGIEINNLFDTQIASAFLGVGETSLDALLQNRFNIRLNKKYQKKDWSTRPLPNEMLAYAAMDVFYLLPLADQLEAELKKENRLYWVDEEVEILSKVRPPLSNSDPLFLKFKGAGKLDPRPLAVLEALLSFRKKVAEKKDRPLFKVFRNATLMTIARIAPCDVRDLNSSGTLSQKQIDMYGDGIIEAVHCARQIPDNALPVYPRNRQPRMKLDVPVKVRALKSWRNARARALGLDPALICSNALASSIATRNPDRTANLRDIPGIKKWQVKEFGKEILATLARVN